MSVGQLARRVLGPAFPVAGSAYRRVFVDVRKVASCIPRLDGGSTLLDIGIGDGSITNPLLDWQPDLRVIGVDLAAGIGSYLRPDLRDRVELHPETSVAELVADGPLDIAAAFMADVLHHVPPPERAGLLKDVLAAFGDRPRVLVVKDIVPQGVRSAAAFWADRNISGDRDVAAIGPAETVALVRSVWPGCTVETTALQEIDYPNYCLVFRDA
jgi:2-polyprenyl-6-hydroxyphenyl methylase/3-demethylubiquinone-9 3-methyltransferase